MLPQYCLKTPETATLSQAELFERFLAAKLRDASAQSTLVETSDMEAMSAEDYFLDNHGCESVCFDTGLLERLLDELRVCDDPAAELEVAIGDLESFLKGLRFLQRDFGLVCELTRTDLPGDDAPIEAFREWEENPRYLLPVIEQKVAA